MVEGRVIEEDEISYQTAPLDLELSLEQSLAAAHNHVSLTWHNLTFSVPFPKPTHEALISIESYESSVLKRGAALQAHNSLLAANYSHSNPSVLLGSKPE